MIQRSAVTFPDAIGNKNGPHTILLALKNLMREATQKLKCKPIARI